MSNASNSNESHSDSDSSVGDNTSCSSPRSEPTDSESDFSDSPTDSLFSDGPHEPDLTGPPPGEAPQYRGKRTDALRQAAHNPLPPPPPAGTPAPAPAPIHHVHHGGANALVIQAAPFNPAGPIPIAPDHE